MKLLRLEIQNAPACGGLLDGLDLSFHRPPNETNALVQPICILGPNGSGKSQLLQLIAEIFQSAWHLCAKDEESTDTLGKAAFRLEFEASISPGGNPRKFRLSRENTKASERIKLEAYTKSGWNAVSPTDPLFRACLPSLIVGYTSGQNETLSLPFLISRAGYATAVREAALKQKAPAKDNRLVLLDYGTHLEVLLANLMLGDDNVRERILPGDGSTEISSFRCIVRLAHSAISKTFKRPGSKRKGIQLTSELEQIIEALTACATCWDYEAKPEIYTFDFVVSATTIDGFKVFFETSMKLYLSLHKLGLLNDLAVKSAARKKMQSALNNRRFAARLSEPQEDDKVFLFEQVMLNRQTNPNNRLPLDYVSLSDGEHQHAQIFGVLSMFDAPNVLFLLDEPESHFNPKWRIQFTRQLTEIRKEGGNPQDVLLTTHAPFVPSDLPREQVLILSKEDGRVQVRRPDIETFGASFDRIMEHCFEVQPPISEIARETIDDLMKSTDAAEVEQGLARLGASVERAFVADHLRQLQKDTGKS